MRKITNRETMKIANPKLRQIVAGISNQVCLAMEKALANYIEPSAYPISGESESLEQICRTYFQSINPEKHQAMAQKALLGINAPKEERREKYGEFAEINLHSKTSIEEQAQSLTFTELRITENDLQEYNGHSSVHGSHHNGHESDNFVRPSGVGGTATQQLSRLVFRIKRVECREQTGEWGEDEIFLGGTAIDESANVRKINQFKVGDFEKGDVWNPSQPRPFATFELNKRVKYPRIYSVVVSLVEEDAGNLTEYLNRLTNYLRDKLKEKITELGIEYLGVYLGILVGEVIGWFIDYVFDYLNSLWDDEKFLPVAYSIRLPSPDFNWDNVTNSLTSSPIYWEFKDFGGVYWIDYDWQLFTAQTVVS